VMNKSNPLRSNEQGHAESKVLSMGTACGL
jgi:hypothetical protein